MHPVLSKIGMVTLEVVVRTNLLHKLVIIAEEGDENTDDFEGLGTLPGGVKLGVLRIAGLRWVIKTLLGLLGPVIPLILISAVEGLNLPGVYGGLVGLVGLVDLELGVEGWMLLEHLKFYHFRWGDDADRHIG